MGEADSKLTTSKFVHLHVHTHYSLLDGACKVSDLVKRTKALGMDSLAITDHGCMFGVIEFFNECKKEGIKPILGMEAYMAPGDRRERSTPSGSGGDAAYHLLLLAKNLEGYKNLIKLSSIAYREGFYYKPRIDKEILRQYSKGLIATSACLGGEVCSAFMKRDGKAARHVAETYAEIFGPEHFYIEVQKQGIKEQDMVNPELVDLAKKLGVGTVATNDVHFLNKDDHFAHDVLCCISMGKLVSDEGRLKYPEHLYLKSPQEMAEACGSFGDAMDNTVRIAQMCDLQLDFSKRYAPVYRVPKEKLLVHDTGIQPVPESMKDDERYLRQLCEEGLTWRYGSTDVSEDIRSRLDYELKIICMKNFCSYFLIVWDFCNFARERGIPVGARGSGVGTMVGYLLGLCNVDPIKYGLLFERFMDPSRNEMPDIDIDICQDGRGKVIEYVRNKYGHVAQIITFGTLAAKAACKDVGRVLGVPLGEIDKLTKMIPGVPGMTIDKAMSQVPDLKALYGNSPQIKQVIDIAKRLEGLCRNAGMHAAGVIIADQPLDEIIPLYKSGDDILTQFEGPIAEKVGLLKMDFLGLRTLSTLTRSIELVKLNKNIDIDIEKIDLADRKVLDLFCQGQTKGVFQFESGGMQDLLMKMAPDRVEDLIAANALYRPGPMELIPLYCNRKHGREKVPEVHPIMDKILEETYGIMCIHEETRIAMADGSERPIREVRKGDFVHSLNRETLKVESKECHGCGPTRRGAGVKITLENGFSVTLTPDHNVYTHDGMKPAGQLDPEKDLVIVGRHLRQERPTARHLAPWLGADEDVAYLLGSLVGDGSITAKGVALATGREEDHRKMLAWIHERLPSLRAHEYFHGRCWYLSLSHLELLNDPAYGNRKTRFHHLLEEFGMKVTCLNKRVPDVIFRCTSKVRSAFLSGLLDADGCTAIGSKGSAICFLSSSSCQLLEDARRLCQLEGIPCTVRKNRIQFWDLHRLSLLLEPHLLVRRFAGKLTQGRTVGWIPRAALHAAVPAGESMRAFSARTGIMRAGMLHDFPFVKSSTAMKAGIDLGDIRYYRITRIEAVNDQQFYGMSVADHHNLVANGIVIKNCYQEQVMQVFNQLGGIELSNAYKLIKAISKKTVDVIAKFQPEFIKGTMAKGVSKEKATEIFDLILKFGGYGFNKSHSTRYAIVAFQTAYMKTYHPVEYMAALLTFEMGSTDKMVEYIEECRRMQIKVLPPDVNVSDKDFTPIYVQQGKRKEKEGVIRFGMCAVRGVGEKAVEGIIDERNKSGKYGSLYEFCERVDLRAVQRSTIDALIKCGAFSSITEKRAPLIHILEKAVEMGQQSQQDKRSGQMNFFATANASPSVVKSMGGALPDVEELPSADLLKFEKELLGFYITSHPLTEHQMALEQYSTATTKEALHLTEGIEVTIGGMINRLKKSVIKNGRNAGTQMANITLEDLEGQIDCTIWSDQFADLTKRFPDILALENIVFVKGKVDRKRETPCIIVNDMIPVNDSIQRLTTAIAVKLDRLKHSRESIEQLGPVLKQHAGNLRVYLQVETPESQKVIIQLGKEHAVKPSKRLVDDVEHLLGNGAVQLRGDGAKRLKRLEQQKLFKEDVAPAEELNTVAANSEEAVLATMDAQMDMDSD